MNENIVEGTGRDIGGSLKQAAGDVLGRNDLRAEGSADKLGGKTQKAAGHAQAAVEELAGPVVDFVRRQPLLSLGIAGVLGYLLLSGGRRD
ncbi:CsbD family protein [Sphingomonas qomolangmaensis]|uniref:CsbD family protein n=1 Tax=Sphingomonas qomolangmaensis TaxID=2918765 RepID=A0ABY5L4R7_9SPHN|nr:CsbD family protein [Sphingomonas qomolangmaensis]UUL81958.1 CsbD family protein [Sphingomonas qomolangmaensis]